MSYPTSDPRIAEAFELINHGALPTQMSERELVVIVLALAERAGANIPWDEDSSAEYAKELRAEADAILDRFLARLTVGR